eukprot:m.34497 g.34497  ORF g.34497 m.34497 type:complete len:428 (+) comp9770_c0_seq2:60-1343(+)
MAEINIRFKTSLPEEYAITDVPLAVPVTLRRSHLSKLVNSLLNDEPETPVPFDFLINNQLLRTSLLDYIVEHDLTTEEIVDVEYVIATLPPKPTFSSVHPDWISSIDTMRTHEDIIVTGCYDGQARIWSDSLELVATLPGHTRPILDVTFATRESVDAYVVATASQDETVAIWDFKNNQPTRCFTCNGHTNAVRSIAARGDGAMVASGSTDATIKMWSTRPDEDDEDEVVAAKKSKGSVEQFEVGAPMLTMQGCKGAVTALSWLDDSTLLSGADDHTLKSWDITTGTEKESLLGAKAITSLAVDSNQKLVAAAGFDGCVRLYDAHSASFGSKAQATLTCSGGPCGGVSWNQDNEYQFVTCALQSSKNLKIWDRRSYRVPVCTLDSQPKKLFDVQWAASGLIVAGGEAGTLHALTVPGTGGMGQAGDE